MLDIGSLTEEIAVIVVENLFRTMLISFSTLKRKSEIRMDYQRRCIHAGGSSVPLLEQIGPTLDESRMLKSMAHSYGPPALRIWCTRTRMADKRRAFVCDRFCDELANMEIDNATGCNLIYDGLLELLGYVAAVRRFNGKLKVTFKGKDRKIESLRYIRAKIDFGSFQEVFILIVVGNGVIHSNVVINAQELKVCHGLLATKR